MSIKPTEVHKTLGKYMLADGFDLVLDLKKSKGCRIFDSRNNKWGWCLNGCGKEYNDYQEAKIGDSNSL